MAAASIFRILLIALVARCRSDSAYTHKNGKPVSKFGELLKPPPPPQLANIVPVPFHGGSRSQRQNLDTGYIYQPPPPPPPPPLPPSSDFKFPAPFYKQYNFNFVPPPQPFTTTPSPSIFQKVSGWLFPSPQTSYGTPQSYSNSIATGKKDCNPCNLVPWIPVLRYSLGAKNIQQNSIPTYGPPSPTAYAPNFISQYRSQPFSSQDQSLPKPGIPHAIYGPPAPINSINNFGIPVATYGPPSPTHTVASPSPPSSTYSIDSGSVGIPSSSYGVPSSSVGVSSTYGAPSASINQPSVTYGQPSQSLDVPSSIYGIPSSTYGPPESSYGTPSPSYGTPRPITSTFSPISQNFEPSLINDDLPQQSDVELIDNKEQANEFQLPKVTHPSGFRNSYGEPISNTYGINNIPFPVSATGAESTKIKTEVPPDDNKRPSTPNGSLALANPAPFTLNRGRNIHTLQPVALPNLSVSPLPPIFNARPFRPIIANPFIKTLVPGINSMQQSSKNVKIEQSVPLAEFTHSIDYPPTVIQSSLIDIEAIKTFNQSKAYRNIPNGYILDEVRDISSQASEDHVEATKSNQESSFETTGADFGNDLYDTNLPSELKQNDKFPSNHKINFADLRGLKDEDIDKYRTDSNLQNIDSPLLYLKPSAPHKDHGSFVFAVSTPGTGKDYEIYDDIPSTTVSPVSTLTSAWDESRNDYSVGLSLPPSAQEDRHRPKVVQIIVPYTTGQQEPSSNLDYENNIPDSWTPVPEDEYQGRKVPSNTEYPHVSTATDSFSTMSTTEETITESYDSERLNTQAILNDLYDVKEPPFDVIKLQHTIDDWTEQEYSKRIRSPHKTRTSAKYAKQIPDEYFTTMSPFTNYVTAATNYYDFYDHEGASSMQHTVTENTNKTDLPRQEYNVIERTKTKHDSAKNEEDNGKKPHIYTAASSFRSTTTTPAPWGSIQTSISPLTKEKIYVVTAEPWNESVKSSDKPMEWYDVAQFESKKTNSDNDVSASDSLLFKSPRFALNRPSIGFTSSGNGNAEAVKSDSSYAFSKSWHQRINDLDNQRGNGTYLHGGADPTDSTTNYYYPEENSVSNPEEDTTTITTADPQENKRI